MELKNLGQFTVDCDSICRLRLSFRNKDLDVHEMEALAAPFLSELSAAGMHHFLAPGIEFAIGSRRDFAMIPQMIRRFEAMGFELGIWVPRKNADGFAVHVWASENAGHVWREIALAQMFYRE